MGSNRAVQEAVGLERKQNKKVRSPCMSLLRDDYFAYMRGTPASAQREEIEEEASRSGSGGGRGGPGRGRSLCPRQRRAVGCASKSKIDAQHSHIHEFDEWASATPVSWTCVDQSNGRIEHTL